MSKTMMFEITLLARLQGLNLIYFLLSKFFLFPSLCHLGPVECSGLHFGILHRERPFTNTHLEPTAWRDISSLLSCPWHYLSAKAMVIIRPSTTSPLHSTQLPSCFHTFNCSLFCQGLEEMGWDGYYDLCLDEETKVHRQEGILIANSCGTLMCQELPFRWGFCASFPLSLLTALR